MAEYKITRVSEEAPKEYQGEHGTTYYIKVMLDGHERPVSIGKKKPDALKVGDTVHGTITETQYETDKFTADKMQGGYSKPSFQPREDHHEAIKAQFAIKAAIAIVTSVDVPFVEDGLQQIEDYATRIYAMVDRVKSSEPKTGYDTFKQAGEAVKAKQETFSDGTPVPTDAELDATNDKDFLDSIPF